MPSARPVELNPRKTPVQARSSASVEAIFEAAIQVLLAVGKAKFTTSRVAQRAGVSVGTLYQYFPNKSALLQAVLRAHLNTIYQELDRACGQAQGKSLSEMAEILVNGYLSAKLRHETAARALYLISDDVGGAEISRAQITRSTHRIAEMLKTAPQNLRADPNAIAQTVISAMNGVSRRLLETAAGPNTEILRCELRILVQAYLAACAEPQSKKSSLG